MGDERCMRVKGRGKKKRGQKGGKGAKKEKGIKNGHMKTRCFSQRGILKTLYEMIAYLMAFKSSMPYPLLHLPPFPLT